MNDTPYIPQELQDRVDRELEPGERVVWTGMPVPRWFTPGSTAAFLFAIPWTGFAVFWICGAAGFQMPDFSEGGFSLFPLFGVPFVMIGLGMLSSPWWCYRQSFKTVYAITDRRAITIDGGWSTTIRSFSPEQLRNVYRKEKRDGSGDVIIARRAWRDSEGDRMAEELGFMRIREPREVERMVKELAGQGNQVNREDQVGK